MPKETNTSTPELADPLVHARAVGASAIIWIGAGAAVGLLWIAAAFSSHDTLAYSHLAWWLGATVIGAAAVPDDIAVLVAEVGPSKRFDKRLRTAAAVAADREPVRIA